MMVSLQHPNTSICQLLPHSVKMSQIKRARRAAFMSVVITRRRCLLIPRKPLTCAQESFPLHLQPPRRSWKQTALCAGVPGWALKSTYSFMHGMNLLTRCSHLVSSSQTLEDSCLWLPSVPGRYFQELPASAAGPSSTAHETDTVIQKDLLPAHLCETRSLWKTL